MKNGVHFEKTTTGFGGIYMFYQCGGLYETPKFRGATHLAEHLACKGEKKFQKDFVMNSFETNALTGDDHVCFYFSGIEELTAKFAEKYLSCRSYIPTREEFELEKQIIIQEVQSALCNNTLGEAMSRGMFNYSGPCGDIDAIASLSYNDFIAFYKDIYAMPSVVVFMGGKQMKKAYDRLGKSIDVDFTKKVKLPIKVNKEPDTTKYKVWSKKDSNSVGLFSIFKGKELTAQISFLMRLFGDGFYSPFYDYIRETKKLCYYIYSGIEVYDKLRFCQIWTETGKEKEFEDTLFDVLGNFEKFIPREYFDDYVEKAETDIRQKQMRGGYGLAYNKYFADENSFFNTFDKTNPVFSYEEMKKLAKKVSKRSSWKKMTHFKGKISFSDKI